MKIPRKMKLIGEVAGYLQKEGKEVTGENVSKWVLGRFGTYDWEKYKGLTGSSIALYFRDFHGKTAQ